MQNNNKHFILVIGGSLVLILTMLLISTNNLLLLAAILGVPVIFIILFIIFNNPVNGIWSILIFGFWLGAIGKYTLMPVGLIIDSLIILTVFTLFFQKDIKWSNLNNPIMIIIFMWFIYTFLEIFNPLTETNLLWVYGIRTISVYLLIVVGLGMLLLDKKYFNTFILIWFGFSVLASLDGIRQMYHLWPFEKHWLYELEAAKQHILFGKLRIFSHFSDTGQFGAAQAHVLITSFIMFINSKNIKHKFLFLSVALLGTGGMMISGTRGALFIAIAGAAAYLIISKNWKIIILGSLIGGSVFYILNSTSVGHTIPNIQRMRTGIDLASNPSFQVRLQNQLILKKYLNDKPFGTGIGNSAYYLNRRGIKTFLTYIPADSLYVRIWIETGIIGLLIYAFLIFFIIIKGASLIWKTDDKEYRNQLMAIWAGLIGIFVGNYGNMVMSQVPTSMIVFISIIFIFKQHKSLDK